MSGNQLVEENKDNSIQCLPLYSILLAMGNPTVNYFRQEQINICNVCILIFLYYSMSGNQLVEENKDNSIQ